MSSDDNIENFARCTDFVCWANAIGQRGKEPYFYCLLRIKYNGKQKKGSSARIGSNLQRVTYMPSFIQKERQEAFSKTRKACKFGRVHRLIYLIIMQVVASFSRVALSLHMSGYNGQTQVVFGLYIQKNNYELLS